jgi:hypothetical protein
MLGTLRQNDVGADMAEPEHVALDDGCCGFVAGRFDAEKEHLILVVF